MRPKLIVAALAAVFSGAAFAGDYGSSEQSQTGSGSDQEMSQGVTGGTEGQAGDTAGTGAATPSGESDMPMTEHQSEAVKEVSGLFEQLDIDANGSISREEAQAMPELKDYWDQQGLGDGDEMSQSDFAQFESQLDSGADVSGAGSEGTGDVPTSPHQEEAVGGDAAGQGGDSGTGSQQ